MKANEIKSKIFESNCKEELAVFLDELEVAINNYECDFEDDEWRLIENVAKWKKKEFDSRVFH